MTEDSHILSGMTLPNATVIFPNPNIQDPMYPVFDTPVFSHRR